MQPSEEKEEKAKRAPRAGAPSAFRLRNETTLVRIPFDGIRLLLG